MPELSPILLAGLTGFISGLLLCIPVGPINLTIINEGARRGFRWAAMIGLGASAMEVIYCAIAFTGFSSFFGNKYIKAAMEVFSFVFMLYLGIKFLMAKTVSAPIHISRAADKLEDRIEEKFHPHSAFLTGLVRVMGNPGVLLFWIFLAVYFMSRDWVQPDWESKLACIGGVAVSTTLWFVGLSWIMSLGHGKFSEKTLLRMEHFSGLGLLGLGLIHGANIAWQLAKHKM
jgi:threonine/homoserine/homoserine lactone efflux protein